jgi:hypothetical protein
MDPEATITIDEVVTYESDFVKFKAQGKTFNCKVRKYIQNATDGKPIFSEGRRLDVVFAEYQPEGQKFASRYINECRPATKPNTWPDKEPYQGGGGSSPRSNNGGQPKGDGDFRSKSQVNRSHTLHALCVLRAGADITLADLLEQCELADNWVMGSSLADKAVSNGGLAEYVAQATETFSAKPEADDDVPF